ncbi:MAG: 3'-5' exonuclease [Treponema sp.]|nr:3'-5' exonuclease [Candidatus Treponema merdequi]
MPQNKFLEDFRKLQSLLDSGTTFVAFDTETTGLSSSSDRVIEIGAVKFDKNGIISKYETFLNPQKPISAECTAINHITDEMVKDAPVAKDELPSFVEFSKDAVLIAHNATFDLNFINAELERAKLSELKNKAIDTLNLIRWAYPLLGKYNLQLMARLMNIKVEDAHRAYDDARVCMEVFLKTLKDTHSIQKK